MSIHGYDEPIKNGMTSQLDNNQIWDSDDDGNISETKKIRQVHHKTGYLEGVTETKEKYLQQGFDLGYPIGALIGEQVGRILGGFQALELTDLERAAKNEMSPDQLFSDKYYTSDGETIFEGEIHPLVEKWAKIMKEYQR